MFRGRNVMISSPNFGQSHKINSSNPEGRCLSPLEVISVPVRFTLMTVEGTPGRFPSFESNSDPDLNPP